MGNARVEMCLLLQVLVGKVAHRPLIVLQLHMLQGFDRPGFIDPRQPVDYCTAQHDIRQGCTLLEHGIPFYRIIRQRFGSCPAQLIISLQHGMGNSFQRFFGPNRHQCQTGGTAHSTDRRLQDLLQGILCLCIPQGTTAQRSKR